MQLRNLFDSLRHSPSAVFTSFKIDDEQVLDRDASGQPMGFVPEETYFEIRLSQMNLRYDREYWRQFVPLASLMTQFLYAGERRTVPFVVGPDLLADISQLSKGDQVEFRNIRVAGPYPYAGDDIELFAGLFRVVTGDWAKPVLSLLELVTKAFDISKISSFVSVTEPLVNGIEALFGMRDFEARMAMYVHLTTPPDDTAQRLPETVMQPGFHVLIGATAMPVGENKRQAFRIRDGKLWCPDDAGRLVEYNKADFMLFQIIPLRSRPDYSTFDFHKTYWPKVVEHIWNGNPDAARQALRLLAANLVQCQDITVPHRNRLLSMYKKKFDEELANHEFFDEAAAAGQGFQGSPQVSLSEAELREAIENPDLHSVLDQTANTQPETLLARLDI
jgi:hypothetical protein